jgi:hypothetical protein
MMTVRWRKFTVVRTALATLCLTALVSTGTPAQTSVPDVSEAIVDAMVYARMMPEAFGGVWLTDGGAAAVFAFTHRATDAQIEDVLGHVPEGVPVTVVRVDWSETEITAAKEAISLAARTGELPFVNGIGIDLEHNAVLVYITPQWFETCQAGVLARFSPMRILFESNAGDIGLDSTPVPPESPSASPPPGCLPPPGWSPVPSMVAPSSAPPDLLSPSPGIAA